MYWPISAPRVYAASNSEAPKERVFRFNEDVESHAETTDGSGSLLNATSASSDAVHEEDNQYSGLLTPLTPMTPGIKPVDHDTQRRLSARNLTSLEEELEDDVGYAQNENILGLRISRTGHLFAVITATSMTIWQTKVSARGGNIFAS
jgi:hypothetical protein